MGPHLTPPTWAAAAPLPPTRTPRELQPQCLAAPHPKRIHGSASRFQGHPSDAMPLPIAARWPNVAWGSTPLQMLQSALATAMLVLSIATPKRCPRRGASTTRGSLVLRPAPIPPERHFHQLQCSASICAALPPTSRPVAASTRQVDSRGADAPNSGSPIHLQAPPSRHPWLAPSFLTSVQGSDGQRSTSTRVSLQG